MTRCCCCPDFIWHLYTNGARLMMRSLVSQGFQVLIHSSLFLQEVDHAFWGTITTVVRGNVAVPMRIRHEELDAWEAINMELLALSVILPWVPVIIVALLLLKGHEGEIITRSIN